MAGGSLVARYQEYYRRRGVAIIIRKGIIAFTFLLVIVPFEITVAQDAKQPRNPASPGYQYLSERARKREEELDQRIAPILAARKERADYYQALRDQYSDQGFPSLRDSDYSFLNEANSIINNPAFGGDAELERDRLYAAAVLANNLQKPIDVVYKDIEGYRNKYKERTAVPDNTPIVIGIGSGVLFIISILIIFIRERNKKQPVKFYRIKAARVPKINIMGADKNSINADTLIKYNTLRKEGAISQEEYDKIKNKILEG